MLLTNEELVVKLKNDLKDNYSVGLNSVNKDKYARSKKYFCTDTSAISENPTNEEIINSILKNGINIGNSHSPIAIIDNSVHLNYQGYVPYINNIMEDWYDREEYYNIIIAMPNSITIDDKEYFIGSICHKNVSMLLCSKRIFPELIYGYYKKEKDSDKLEFYQNDRHISKLSEVEHKLFINKFISDYFNNVESFLKFINYDENYILFNGDTRWETIINANNVEAKYYNTTKDKLISKKQLFQTVIDDLGSNYQIGLHNINDGNFKEKINDELYFNVKVEVLKNFNTTDIVKSILNNDLNVPEGTLHHTVVGFGNILENNEVIFDYCYYGPNEDGFIYQLIVAIPTTFKINSKEYFAGKFISKTFDMEYSYMNILSNKLFRKRLPKEFIYGGYIKHAKYDDELFFIKNPHHISRLSDEEKEKLYLNLIADSEITTDLLDELNSENVKYKEDDTYWDNKLFNNTLSQRNEPNGEYPLRLCYRKKQTR